MSDQQSESVFGAEIEDYSDKALREELFERFGRAAEMIAQAEGLRRRMYADLDARGEQVGSAIGVGHNLSRPITRRAALLIFLDDLEAFEDELRRKWDHYAKLDPVRARAILALVFQVGVPGFLGFKRTIAALEAGDYGRAAVELGNSRWYEQTQRERTSQTIAMVRTGDEPEDQEDLISQLRAYDRDWYFDQDDVLIDIDEGTDETAV